MNGAFTIQNNDTGDHNIEENKHVFVNSEVHLAH